jgi:hypothetical protein
MKIKASLVVMSHLSDIQEQLNWQLTEVERNEIADNINFVKFLILQCNGNLNQEIDADEMWKKYKNR